MNIAAENKTVITKKLFFEGMNAATGYRRTALKAVAVLGVLWIGLLIFSLVQHISLFITAAEFVIAAALSAWLLLLFPYMKINRAYKAFKEKNGENAVRTIRFYDTYLSVKSAAGEKKIEYTDICKKAETGRLLTLICNDGTGIMLLSDGFTFGNSESALEQINNFKKMKGEDQL